MADPIQENLEQNDALDDIMNFAHGETSGTTTTAEEDGVADDPWMITGLSPTSQGATEGAESNQGNAGQQVAPTEPFGSPPGQGSVDDPNSYKYFQSRYDQAEADRQRLLKTLGEQQALIAQYQVGQSYGTQEVNQAYRAAGSQALTSNAPLQMPIKPEMPADFDRIDANTDPDSTSYQYLQAIDRYRDEQASYFAAQIERRDVADQREREKREQDLQMGSYRTELQARFRMDNDTIDDFFKVVDDPEILTLENLYALYKHVKGIPGQAAPVQTRAPSAATLPLPPIPASTGSSASRQPVRNDSDKVIDDLIAYSNKNSFRL